MELNTVLDTGFSAAVITAHHCRQVREFQEIDYSIKRGVDTAFSEAMNRREKFRIAACWMSTCFSVSEVWSCSEAGRFPFNPHVNVASEIEGKPPVKQARGWSANIRRHAVGRTRKTVHISYLKKNIFARHSGRSFVRRGKCNKRRRAEPP